MEVNSYSSEEFLKDMIETLTLLSSKDLDKLQDAIAEEVEKRKNERFIELRKKAINAMREYFQAGGCIMNGNDNCSLRLDDDRLLYDDENSIYESVNQYPTQTVGYFFVQKQKALSYDPRPARFAGVARLSRIPTIPLLLECPYKPF